MCKLVIDTGALARNLEKLRHYTSARIIAVVKGGGYGLGLVPYARWLTAQGVDMLAVSSVAEAAALRDAGITADVLMLASTALPEEVSALLARNVILTVGSLEAARTVSAVAEEQGVTARVHIKLDTGMGRCGPPASTPACATSAPPPRSCGIRSCIWTRCASARRCWAGCPCLTRWGWKRSAGWRPVWRS